MCQSGYSTVRSSRAFSYARGAPPPLALAGALLHRLNYLLQFGRQFGNECARQFHPPIATLAYDDVERAEGGILVGIVVAKVAAAALAPLDGRSGNRFGHRQQIVEIERRVPARVVLAVSADADAARPRSQRVDAVE